MKRALMALLLTTLPAGCKRSGGPPAVAGIRPADDVRGGLLATVTVSSLDRALGDVDGLARKLQLPFSGKDLMTTLAAQNRMPPELLSLVDTSQPIGVAFVVPGKGAPPFQAIALEARSPEALAKLLAGLGTTETTDEGARKIRRPDSTILWVVASGRQLIASASADGVRAAGSLALEARRTTAEDVVVHVFPESLARWQGTDVATALAQLRKEAVGGQEGVPLRPSERAALDGALERLMAPLPDTRVGTLSFDVDPTAGLRFHANLDPRSGSPLARRLARPTAYKLDHGLLAGPTDPLAVLSASGATPLWLELLDAVLAAEARAGIKGAATLQERWLAFRRQLAPGLSTAIRARRNGASVDIVWPLAAGATGASALEAFAALASAQGTAEVLREVYLKQAPEIRVRRELGLVVAELAFPVRHQRNDIGAAVEALFGSGTLGLVARVDAGRFLLSTEPEARTRMAGGTPLPVPVEVEETRGADAFVYVDLWASVRSAMGAIKQQNPQQAQMLGMLSMIPGIAQLKLPVVASYRSGQSLDGELHVPLGTLMNAAAVLRPMMGIGALP